MSPPLWARPWWAHCFFHGISPPWTLSIVLPMIRFGTNGLRRHFIAPGQLPLPLSVGSTRRSATVRTGGEWPPQTLCCVGFQASPGNIPGRSSEWSRGLSHTGSQGTSHGAPRRRGLAEAGLSGLRHSHPARARRPRGQALTIPSSGSLLQTSTEARAGGCTDPPPGARRPGDRHG